jgi:hypothetical protein
LESIRVGGEYSKLEPDNAGKPRRVSSATDEETNWFFLDEQADETEPEKETA